MESRFIERQTMHRGPQIQGVALRAAAGVEALKDVLAEVRRNDKGTLLNGTADQPISPHM
jgi:hypothetical protein